MSSSDNDGLMSSAGLVRYFDSEDSAAPTVDPKTILALSALMGIATVIAKIAVV